MRTLTENEKAELLEVCRKLNLIVWHDKLRQHFLNSDLQMDRLKSENENLLKKLDIPRDELGFPIE